MALLPSYDDDGLQDHQRFLHQDLDTKYRYAEMLKIFNETTWKQICAAITTRTQMTSSIISPPGENPAFFKIYLDYVDGCFLDLNTQVPMPTLHTGMT